MKLNRHCRFRGLFVLSCLLLSSPSLFSQYRFSNEVFHGKDTVAYDKYDHNFLMKGFQNKLYYIFKTEDSVHFDKIDLDNGKCFSLGDKALSENENFYVKDVAVNDHYVLIIGYGRILEYNIERNEMLFAKYRDALQYYRFFNGRALNDSLFLLYEIYDTHPKNGFSGLKLHVYNCASHSFVKHRYEKFSDVFMSSMSVNWVCSIKDKIYCFHPLSGTITVYDFNLEKEKSLSVSALYNTMSSNMELRSYYDSLWEDYATKIKAGKPVKNIFTKNVISQIEDTVMNHCDFIEKVFPVNDSLIAISFCRPGYKLAFRDLLLYNPIKDSVVKIYTKWRTGKAENVNRVEDYYVLDLINDEYNAPYFYKQSIYFSSLFPTSEFFPSTLDSVNERKFNFFIKNGFSWHLLRYDFQ